jgi:hypothetical protein
MRRGLAGIWIPGRPLADSRSGSPWPHSSFYSFTQSILRRHKIKRLDQFVRESHSKPRKPLEILKIKRHRSESVGNVGNRAPTMDFHYDFRNPKKIPRLNHYSLYSCLRDAFDSRLHYTICLINHLFRRTTFMDPFVVEIVQIANGLERIACVM